MTVADLISVAADRLKRARIEDPRLEAESLLAYLLGRDLSWPLAHPEAEVGPAVVRRFAKMISRRARREPYAYVVGEKAFYGRVFKVTPATLIPRPETETLIEGVLAHLPADSGASILDIGAGGGAIGITLAAERTGTKVFMYDISTKALSVAAENVRRLKMSRRVRSSRLDILRQVPPEPKTGFVAVAANLPYLPTAAWKRAQPEVRLREPKLALVSGADGLRHYHAMFRRLAQWKRKPDLIALEAEPGQFEELALLARSAMKKPRVEIMKDLHGDDRVLIASAR